MLCRPRGLLREIAHELTCTVRIDDEVRSTDLSRDVIKYLVAIDDVIKYLVAIDDVIKYLVAIDAIEHLPGCHLWRGAMSFRAPPGLRCHLDCSAGGRTGHAGGAAQRPTRE